MVISAEAGMQKRKKVCKNFNNALFSPVCQKLASSEFVILLILFTILAYPIQAQVLYIFFVISSMTIYTFLVLYLDVSNQFGLVTDEKSGHKTIDTFLQVLYGQNYVSDAIFYAADGNY